MRKALLLLILIALANIAFAAFPKPDTDSTQSSSHLLSPPAIRLDFKSLSLPRKHFSFIQKTGLFLWQHQPGKHQSKWLVVVAGILLGVTGIGYLVSLLTHNEDLRKGAKIGVKIFLSLCLIYVALILAAVFLFLLLGNLK